MIDQLKQADLIKIDNTDATKSVDPTTRMKNAVPKTTTATSVNQTSSECLPKLNLLATENQQVDKTTKDCVPEKIC